MKSQRSIGIAMPLATDPNRNSHFAARWGHWGLGSRWWHHTTTATHEKHATKTEADINQTSGGGGQKGTRPRPRPSSMAMSLCHIIAGDVVLCCWLSWLGLGWSWVELCWKSCRETKTSAWVEATATATNMAKVAHGRQQIPNQWTPPTQSTHRQSAPMHSPTRSPIHPAKTRHNSNSDAATMQAQKPKRELPEVQDAGTAG